MFKKRKASSIPNSAVSSIPIRRSELTSKEEELQKCSKRKRVSELEDSLEKYKKSNSSQRKTSNADNEDKYSYVLYCSAYEYITISLT